MIVGDYVRSDKGIIAKITNINKTGSIVCDRNIYYGFNVVSNKRVLCDLSKIIKSSPNIIDLIEVGDYVNGKEITGVDEYTKQLTYEYGETTMYIDSENIKSIVTKEQFEAMKYEIK